MKTYPSQAFSLIELAVVISIIALVGGLSLSVGTTQVKVTKIRQATQTTDNVKTALLTYVKKAGRYPCPANPALTSTDPLYGLEITGCDAACPAGLICNGDAIQGAIPFKTIGLSEAASYDSWDNKLTYVIDKAHVSSSTYGNGSLPVYDAAGNEITASPVLGKAIFLLLSHGSDGKGAYKRDGTLRAACGAATSDSENCDGDGIYRSASFNDAGNATTTPTYYQDFLSWHTQDKVEEITIATGSSADSSSEYLYVTSTHTCIINPSGTLQCSGRGINGALAQGVAADSNIFVTEGTTFGDWVSISGRGDNGCGIRSNGRAYCWGAGHRKLGNGTTDMQLLPREVSGFHEDWVEISSADFNSCGIRQVGANRKGFCWGHGWHGAIGDGFNSERAEPVEIAGSYQWKTIKVGDHHACGITMSGEAYCWGRGNNGRLGDGDLTGTSKNIPTLVTGGFSDWEQIHGTGMGSCAIRAGGRLYCWGRNPFGQLGNGTNIPANVFEPVEVDGAYTDWTKVRTGDHTTCGIRNEGELYCWGANWFGFIGDNTGTERHVPTRTLGVGGAAAYDDWVDVSVVGQQHTCGVRSSGQLYCWGRNEFGQFGNGTATTSSVNTPTAIAGISVKVD